eukprot:12683858-Alexandrium_andersonii.AAC.1
MSNVFVWHCSGTCCWPWRCLLAYAHPVREHVALPRGPLRPSSTCARPCDPCTSMKHCTSEPYASR